MSEDLTGVKVAILVMNGFEQSELVKPRQALQEAGATTHLVSAEPTEVKGWDEDHWGDTFPVDVPLDDADETEYDALLLPGGEENPQHLRKQPNAVEFARKFVEGRRPIAAICHGPLLLIDAGVVKGRRLTSFPGIQSDLKNAGADWVDEEVVVDDFLVTSRTPKDIPAFNRETIKLFARVKKETGAGLHTD
ncbi:MAG: type 1 glutamine amidotransferase [Verrucomicrobia bacterium]|nr:type 1 glutamine amidotransferase [Verrucomicrobiota bacterium]